MILATPLIAARTIPIHREKSIDPSGLVVECNPDSSGQSGGRTTASRRISATSRNSSGCMGYVVNLDQ